jgi:hypothetical protein
MPKLLKCDHFSCSRLASEADACDWLKLDTVGVESEWRRETFPLYFCCTACLLAFFTEKP